MLDSFTQLVILLPLGCYFLVIGIMNSRRSPWIVSGTRDFFALALGCTGLFLLGPFSLFFPQSAFNLMGGWVWLALFILYLLIVTLIALALRPRLLVYSVDSSSFVQRFHQLLIQLDPNTQWAGTSFHCPQLSVEGYVESRSTESVAQIIGSNRDQDLLNWMRLQRLLQQEMRQWTNTRKQFSSWIVVGLILVFFAVSPVIMQPQETLATMKEVLRF